MNRKQSKRAQIGHGAGLKAQTHGQLHKVTLKDEEPRRRSGQT
jgi:hypothetical protein